MLNYDFEAVFHVEYSWKSCCFSVFRIWNKFSACLLFGSLSIFDTCPGLKWFLILIYTKSYKRAIRIINEKQTKFSEIITVKGKEYRLIDFFEEPGDAF